MFTTTAASNEFSTGAGEDFWNEEDLFHSRDLYWEEKVAAARKLKQVEREEASRRHAQEKQSRSKEDPNKHDVLKENQKRRTKKAELGTKQVEKHTTKTKTKTNKRAAMKRTEKERMLRSQEICRSGAWSKEERLAFLRGFRKYGRRWKKIQEEEVTTRSTIQIKSHGQKILEKIEAGEDVYSELDKETAKDDKNNLSAGMSPFRESTKTNWHIPLPQQQPAAEHEHHHNLEGNRLEQAPSKQQSQFYDEYREVASDIEELLATDLTFEEVMNDPEFDEIMLGTV